MSGWFCDWMTSGMEFFNFTTGPFHTWCQQPAYAGTPKEKNTTFPTGPTPSVYRCGVQHPLVSQATTTSGACLHPLEWEIGMHYFVPGKVVRI